MDLPNFKYHPDPEGNDVIEESDEACICCNKKRGYIYTGPVYAIEELDEQLCPWCIANGEAAKKFDASFADAHPLLRDGIAKDIVDEVSLRTPSYSSWQQEQWLSHCNDACEFHGDASEEDVRNASEETKQQWMQNYQSGEDLWNTITEGYYPKGDNAIYKFKCRHCNQIIFGWDCS